MITETIPAALDGERLDRVVSFMSGVSRSQARSLVEAGSVVVDGAVQTSGKVRVTEGQVVSVEVEPTAAEPEPLTADPSVDVPVVHVDDHLVVVDKPVGLVVHPGAGHGTGTLVHGLLARYPEVAGVGEPDRPGIVHRLDRDTTGLLVVARTAEAHAGLVAALAARSVTRRYDTVVVGHPASPAGLIDAPIGRHPRARTRMAVVADGKEARTRYETVATFDEPVAAALLSCTLETGRTHQIRVHLAAVDAPVLGDPVYGRDPLGVGRPLLHAAELGFTHPVTGADVRCSSPRPADFEAVLARLR